MEKEEEEGESGDEMVKGLMLLPNYLAAWLIVDGGYTFG